MEAVLTSVPSGSCAKQTHTCGMTTAARGKVVWTIIVKSIKIVKLRLTVDRYCPYRLAHQATHVQHQCGLGCDHARVASQSWTLARATPWRRQADFKTMTIKCR